ncbi:MAG: hypothetical protein EGR08_03130 [Prevotella sp.]|nr:hypothetical protein [Prevotella sp.]
MWDKKIKNSDTLSFCRNSIFSFYPTMIKYVIEYVIFFLGFCKVRQLFRYKQIKIATFAFYFQQITFSDAKKATWYDLREICII